MAFIDCIQQRVDKGLLQNKQAEVLQESYEKLAERYKSTMGDEAAANMAAQDMARVAADIRVAKNLNVIRSVQKVKATTDILNKVKAAGRDVKKAAKDLAKEKIMRTWRRQEAIEKQLYQVIDEKFFELYRSKMGGFSQDVEGIIPVIRELIEPDSTSATQAGKFAKSIRAAYNLSRERLKSGGAIIGKVENYIPLRHNRLSIRKLIKEVGDIDRAFDSWSATLLPGLDRKSMIDWDTGLPFTDDALRKAMREDFDNIRTNGGTKLEAQALEGKVQLGKASSVAQRYEASKFYIFKDADSFLDYNRQFGVGDEGLFDLITGSFKGYARDISLLEEFGPNPQSVFDNLRGAMGQSGRTSNWLTGMFDDVMGRTNSMPDDMDNPIYSAFATLWNVQRAAMLGSAPLSAINDATFLGVVAKMNDMPVTETLGNWTKLLANDPNSKQIAKDIGFISDYVIGKTMSGERFFGEMDPAGKGAWLASAANRVSGLNHMTIAAKEAMAITQATMWARNSNVPWEKLDDTLKEMMDRFQINKQDWDDFRKTKPRVNEDYNSKYIVTSDLQARADLTDMRKMELIGKFDEWTSGIMSEAINAPDPRTRSITTGAALGNSFGARVISKSVFMFKSWPIQVMFNRFADDVSAGNVSRVGATVMFGTLLGAMSMQAKEIAKGRTPQDTNDPKFWLAAAAQGGGFGILGDFMFYEHDRYGRDFLTSSLGPTAALFSDTTRATMGNGLKALNGEDASSALGDIARIVERNTPFHSLWYGRAAVERLLFDSIERMVDPGFEERQLKAEKRLRERGQERWAF